MRLSLESSYNVDLEYVFKKAADIKINSKGAVESANGHFVHLVLFVFDGW